MNKSLSSRGRRGPVVDFTSQLEGVIEEIRRAKPVPFSASAMINKKDILERLESVLKSAPDDLKTAHSVMREREEVLAWSEAEAQDLIARGREEVERLVARSEIVTAAHREAERILEKAKVRARGIRLEAEDYVDAKLAEFEMVLQKTLAGVGKGREALGTRLEPPARMEPESAAEAEQSAPASPVSWLPRRRPAS